MGSAGFEPANSSAQGWHHTKLDNDPLILQLNNIFYYIILSFGSFLLNYCSFKIRLKNYAVMTSTIFSIGIMVCSDWATVIPLPSIKTGYA